MIINEFGYDVVVSGAVIGDMLTGWCVVYDGRPQSEKHYADTAVDAEAAGRALIAELKAKWCGHPCYLYPDSSKWEIRIYE
jgi:hypothetical protein